MGTIECPVCTLYLRADMSLEAHLETHPKEQVIKALVSMATKPPPSPSVPPPATTPVASAPPSMELAPMPIPSFRSRTPPNALMYHTTSGYEPVHQTAHPSLAPPQSGPMMTNSVPTSITVVKASDMRYPMNNVMIVKSCSTKFVQQMPPGSGNPGGGGASGVGGTATYASGPIDGRSIFIEPDRGGDGTAGITVRRQLTPSLYPRYTNERYSGPPPPYSTAISSTVTASSQLQQSSITGFTSKYEQKPVPQQLQQQHQQPCYPNPPPAPPVVQTTPTITISHHQQHQQQLYQAPPPPPPPPPMLQQQQPQVMIQQQHQQFQASTSFKAHNFLQAQYTEKEDGHFIVTENPKKIVEYTENDEGDFMVIEKIVKSPPRIVQITDDIDESPCQSRQESPSLSNEHEDHDEEEQEEYEMEIDDEEQYEEKVREDQSQISTIEIVENDDGTFDDNQGSYGIKDMPKPILIGSIGSGKKCNKFNLFVESSPVSAGHSSTSCFTPRKKPASGLKVLSNVKVTTDLSQGIKDIILNLNCKNKTSSVAGCSGSVANVDGMKTSLISGVKPAAVVNNNCQNELIINAGSNMPPIDLNDVNDIEIINDDEEDIRSGEDEECYIGSMEVKATNSGNSHIDKESSEASSSASAISASRTTPTPSVITSVIRMTPHPSPVIAPSPPPPQPIQTAVVPAIETLPVQLTEPVSQEKTAVLVDGEIPSSSSASAPKPAGLMAPRKLHSQPSVCGSMGSLFNKPPKKLTVKLKTPLPPAPPSTPPLLPTVKSENGIVTMFVPKVERFTCDDDVEQALKAERQISTYPPTSLLMAAIGEDAGAPSYIPQVTHDESKYSAPNSNQVQSQISPSSFVGKGLSTDVKLNSSSTETITSTVVTTKVENDAQLSETILLTQSSAHCSRSGSSIGSSSNSSFHDGLHHIQDAAVPVSSQEIVQTTTTTTTEVECYNITFIDDEAAALNSHPIPESSSIAAHEVVEQSLDVSNSSTVVKPEMEVDQKTNIAEMCDLKIAEIHSLSPYNGSHVGESEHAPSPVSGELEQPESMLKNCIKVEKVEIISKQELEELVSCATIDGQKVEHKIAKVEPTATVTSLSACSKSEFQKDQKDFLEAGPSRATTTVDDGSGGSVSHSRMGNGGPTFLEYSAEYDDYVPVSGYGIPQEQIPLSWVQKFSPQYTPFDDQNSYMDLDICSSKNNSNSVGGNSATSGSASGGSGSRIDNSMDRAPSAESLNIRTDEKMPAKGEISEQESNGDMELSWNRLYPIHENIPIYPSSYDLSTAQECWNLSNRNSSGHNNSSNSSTSNNNNSLGGPAGTSTGTMSHQYNILPHHNNHHHQQHQSQHSHGISFPFSQQDQQRNGGEGVDDQVDDKSKIHLDYGASSSSGTNYLGLGPSGSSALQDEASRKLAKVRTYHCTECPKSFALLKQRRAHMSSEHDIDSKVNVLAPATATVTSGVSSTVTSGSALGFFSSPGEGCSTTLLNKKIKIESQPMLMSYSSLKLELEQKQEGAAAGPSSGTSAAGSAAAATGEIRRKRTYVCGTCKQEFDRFKLFNAHLMTHPAECYTCGRSFKHWPNFALHIKRHLGIKDHQCRLCGKKFVIKQKLIEHMRVHTGKAPIKCPDCDQHFRRFSNLAQHRNRHHLNKVPSKKDFVCHCGEVYQSKAKMEWHKEIHENKPKSCPFCREKFIHKNSLTRHIRLSHTEKYVKLETATEMCTICNQPYIKTSMKRHMETHTEERMAYSCAICNKLFSTNWNLKQHKWTHANPTLKPFQCNMCSSGFVREADYITHMNAHKSIRPYTCNHCGCQFIRKYNWIRHTREHETDKNYTCEICGRKFHRKYYLTEHKRIHTGERPFSCNICGKTSSTKTNHNKHIKIHHARDPLTAEG